MPEELELRFAAPERELARIAKGSALHGLTVGRAATRRLNSIYFDTAKFSIAKAGLSMRVRKKGSKYVQTVKEENTGALANARHEYESELPSPLPDLDRIPDERVRNRVQSIANGAPIEPVIETDILRTTRSVKTHAGDEVELAVDRGEIGTVKKGHAGLAVSELELELKGGSPILLYDIARRLSRKAPLAVSPESKSARGLRALEGQAIDTHKAGRAELSSDCTAEEAFRATLLHCLRHVARNIPPVAEARLPEVVHKLRVGLRRPRAALSASGGDLRLLTSSSFPERSSS